MPADNQLIADVGEAIWGPNWQPPLASALVARDAVAASCAAVDGFAAAWPALDITCTGPWPPWSFVEDPNDG